ncbi:hypothetical protein B0H13DRAFT_1872502 [Mycena leptocephala]|nr:hypothetical protein B0H13DRAFT_1872502 [Mycena leptocephala]
MSRLPNVGGRYRYKIRTSERRQKSWEYEGCRLAPEGRARLTGSMEDREIWGARSRSSTTWNSNQGVQVWSADGDPEGGSWGALAEMKREEGEGKKSGALQKLQWTSPASTVEWCMHTTSTGLET